MTQKIKNIERAADIFTYMVVVALVIGALALMIAPVFHTPGTASPVARVLIYVFAISFAQAFVFMAICDYLAGIASKKRDEERRKAWNKRYNNK